MQEMPLPNIFEEKAVEEKITGPDNESFLGAQSNVLDREREEKKIKMEHMMSFIISNAPLFRYFAEHLPKDLYKVWDAAAKDKETNNNQAAIEELSQHYDSFREGIMSTLEFLDPETVSALSDAVDNADVEGASTILKAYFETKDEGESELANERLAA